MMCTTSVRDLLRPGGTAVVLGYGGSGRAAHEAIVSRGLRCRVADRAADTIEETAARPIERRGPDDDVSLLDGATFVVKSPGVSREHAMVRSALRAGVPVIAEVDVGRALTDSTMIAVTGSNGKSTTTALLAHVLDTSGIEARPAGNIGEPVTTAASAIGDGGVLVVELSSFQLEDVVEFSCTGAVVLNVTPDHLDRHGSFDAYRDIKISLLDRVRPDGFRIVNRDDPALSSALSLWRDRRPESTVGVGLGSPREREAGIEGDRLVVRDPEGVDVVGVGDLSLAGPHNQFNALTAACAALRLGAPIDGVREGLRTFHALRHRLELVDTIGGVRYVNDSKATNLDSLRQAIRSFPAGDVVLIAGGRDKDSPFEEVADEVRGAVRHVVLIGEAAPRIARAWPSTSSSVASTLDEAVSEATRIAKPSGVVLLSPGCASFDMFRSFVDRGDQFVDAVARRRREETNDAE